MSQALARPDRAKPLRRPVRSRRRPRRWRTALSLVAAAMKASILVGAPLAVGFWIAISPTFAVRQISIEGNERVSEEWVRRALEPLEGRHVFRVSLGAVQERLAVHPWVAETELHKELPDRVVVTVREREPVAVLRRGGELHYVDAGGRTIAPVEAAERRADGAGGLLEVVAGTSGPVPVDDAVAVVEELEGVRPDWVEGLGPIELLGAGDCRLATEALPFDLVLRRGRVASGVDRLSRVIRRLADDGGDAGSTEGTEPPAWVDLRFEDRAIVHPQSGVGGEERDRTALTER